MAIRRGVRGYGHASRRLSAASSAAPSAFTPPNWDVIYYGDSRTSDGIGSAASQTTGYNAGSNNFGPAGWLPPLSGNKLRHGRYPGFGIGGNTSAQAAAVPRLDATSTASAGRWDRPDGNYAGNKGALDAAAHDAGIVVLLIGTNDANTSSTEANIATIMDNIGPTKLIVLLNETPRGINPNGTGSAVANAAARYALSRELLKYDFASGDAKARANVIAVNSFDAIMNPDSMAAPVNIAGTLRDGVHFTPSGAKTVAQAIVDRLSAVYGSVWTALPRQGLLPTANGLVTPANTQPFVGRNPIMTPGANGVVSGTWGTPPQASGVPETWSLNITGAGGSGVACVATKGADTDPDGFPALKLEFSGTMAASSTATVNILQTVSGATEIAAGRLALTDKLRGIARIKVAPGSQNLIFVQPKIFVQDAASARYQTMKSVGSVGTANTALNIIQDAGDGEWYDFLTELVDMQDPNLVAQNQNVTSLTNLQFYVEMNIRNFTASPVPISGTVWIARAGIYRVL